MRLGWDTLCSPSSNLQGFFLLALVLGGSCLLVLFLFFFFIFNNQHCVFVTVGLVSYFNMVMSQIPCVARRPSSKRPLVSMKQL